MTSSWLCAPRRRIPVSHRALAAAIALSLASVVVVPAAGASTLATTQVASTGTEAVVTGVLASFYRPPDPLPYAPAGTIIRSEMVSPDPGLPTGTRAWRVLYHSTSGSGGDLAESGVVVVPGGTPPPGGFPIVSWAHGTTGVASGCAPSVTGTSPVPDLAAHIRSSQIVVATDYRGLGAPGRHPYLVGISEAQDVLDAARAARSLLGGAASNAVAVLGFSQGGQAALFAGEVAPSYAPELFLAGVAAVAPVTSVLDLAPTGDQPPPSGQSAFTAMVLYAWARHYGTFRLGSVLTPAGIADLSAVSSSCVNTIASLYDAVAPGRFFLPGWQARPAVQAANRANRPGNAPTSAPILIVQGTADAVVPFAQTTRFVTRQLCSDQYDTVDYVAERGMGHSQALDQSTALIDRWLQARFSGKSGTDSCTRPGLGVPTSH
jgi:pimeloyl-ACP methyl ester carboxylesterase